MAPETYPLEPPLTCDGFGAPFMVKNACQCKRVGITGIRHTLVKQEWDDMYGVVYTPDAVTDESKIHGVAAAG